MGENLRISLKPDDADIVREIMKATGVSTGADAVGMLVRKFGPVFLDWWHGHTSPVSTAHPPSEPIATKTELIDPGDSLEPIEL
jgi:hypothetical protein